MLFVGIIILFLFYFYFSFCITTIIFHLVFRLLLFLILSFSVQHFGSSCGVYK